MNMLSNFFSKLASSDKSDKNAATLSLPQRKELYGIKIEKLPIGRYIEAIESFENLPQILIKEVFPDSTPDEVLQKLKRMNEDMLIEIAGNMFKTIPEQLLKFISKLLKCDYDYLYNNITPSQLLEVLTELWKMNDVSNFINALKKAVM